MNHKKHISRWFTTSSFRAINLDWVTDVKLHKNDDIITGATVYWGLNEGEGQLSSTMSAEDAARLFDLLV